jgi:hypothetical protein
MCGLLKLLVIPFLGGSGPVVGELDLANDICEVAKDAPIVASAVLRKSRRVTGTSDFVLIFVSLWARDFTT